MFNIDIKTLKKTNKLMKKRLSYWIRQSSLTEKKELLNLVNINPYATCVHLLNEDFTLTAILKDTVDTTMELLTITTFMEIPTIEDFSDNGKAAYYGTMLVLNKSITEYEFMCNRDNFYSKLQEDLK